MPIKFSLPVPVAEFFLDSMQALDYRQLINKKGCRRRKGTTGSQRSDSIGLDAMFEWTSYELHLGYDNDERTPDTGFFNSSLMKELR